MRSYFWSVFTPNAGKYGPEITSYLDTFNAVLADQENIKRTNQKWGITMFTIQLYFCLLLGEGEYKKQLDTCMCHPKLKFIHNS